MVNRQLAKQLSFNRTECHVPDLDLTLSEIFERQVMTSPSAIALVDEHERLTFARVGERVNQLAGELLVLGLQPEDLVAIHLERSVDFVIAILATWKIACGFLPLDISYPNARLKYMLHDSGAKALITRPGMRESLEIPESLQMFAWSQDRTETAAPVDARIFEGRKSRPGSIAYVVYTSGSTGQPKGVIIEHQGAINIAWQHQQVLYKPNCVDSKISSLTTPFSFDVSIEAILTVLYGHTLNIVPEAIRLDPKRLIDYVEEQAINILGVSPSFMVQLLGYDILSRAHSLTLIILGGEDISIPLWAKLCESGRTIYNAYGPTECTIDTACINIRSSPDIPTIGRPFGNTQIYILDSELNAVDTGVDGEIYIAGLGIGRGYVGDNASKPSNYIPNPHHEIRGDRLYRTGDRGHFLDNGNVVFVGRVDRQVKVRGYRIDLNEVESALLDIEEVVDAAVMLRKFDIGDSSIYCYVIVSEGTSDKHILNALKLKLPSYMIPSRIIVVPRFPLTLNGKLDTEAIKVYERRVPEAKPASSAKLASLTESIAGIWSEVLHCDPQDARGDFFEQGGDSLRAMKLILKCSQLLGRDIPISCIYENSDFADFCAALH